MKRYLFFLLVILGSCHDKSNETIEIEYKPKAKLLLLDSLVFKNTDNIIIGSVRDIEVIEDRVYISDMTQNKIHILDNNMRYINSIGRFGGGPGEFNYPPYLTKKNDTLVVYKYQHRILMFYNKNNELIKEINLPKNYFFSVGTPLFINDKIVFEANNRLIRELTGNLDDYTTVLLLDSDGVPIKAINKLMEDYKKNYNLLYYARNPSSKISHGFGNTLLVIQKATICFQQYTPDGEYIKTLAYKPRFYLSPPTLKVSQELGMDMDKLYEKYYSISTYYSKIIFDVTNNLLYTNYRSLHRKQYLTRSFIDADNYLYIIDENEDCIFDEKINGYLVAVDNGVMYILSEESPDKIVLCKYEVKR